MRDFWKLVTILISMIGFLITGGVLLLRGESLVIAIVRSVIVFIILYVIQNFLGSILVATAENESEKSHPGQELKADEQQAARN